MNTAKFIKIYFRLLRSFEAFKYIHLGMMSEIKRKTLPAIAKVVGLKSEQSLHHFLTSSPWSAKDLEAKRLKLILTILDEREIILLVDETGDKKKGKSTDYVKRQYIGNLGKVESGIVAVTTYGLLEGMTFPLMSEVYKPKERLKEGDVYKSKPVIAGEMIAILAEMGFKFKLVLADSLYGESDVNFVSILHKFELQYILAIRSNHAVWMPNTQRVRYNQWRLFERKFSDGKSETRYIREIIFGKKREVRYWQITTDKNTLPANTTWYVMTKVPDIKYKEVGNLYGLRTWVEYGLKQSKNELGWADFRVTDYSQIEKWWEIVMSAYLMVSLYADPLQTDFLKTRSINDNLVVLKFSSHCHWNEGKGWKNLINNLRLIIQPFCCFNQIKPWLSVFPIPQLSLGFPRLIALMNFFTHPISEVIFEDSFYYSSA
jgi:SRSO17 transposase